MMTRRRTKDGDSEGLFLASPAIIDLHFRAERAALTSHEVIRELLKARSPHPLASGALWSMWADIVALHRASLWLCRGGWAAAAPGLLRTMIELGASGAVVVNERACELEGFRYSYAELRATAHDAEMPPSVREDARSQLQLAIDRMPAELRNEAVEITSQKPAGPYWYNPLYKGPKQVLTSFMKPDIYRFVYGYLSDSAHGSFCGMRLFRDNPDEMHPNPRLDPASQTRTLAISSRMLLEFCRLRAEFEAPGSAARVFNRLISEAGKAVEAVAKELGWSLPVASSPADDGGAPPKDNNQP